MRTRRPAYLWMCAPTAATGNFTCCAPAARNGQASLAGVLCALGVCDLRVDHVVDLVPCGFIFRVDVRHRDEESLHDAYLRSGNAYSVCRFHGIDHVSAGLPDAWSYLPYRFAFFGEYRFASDSDISECHFVLLSFAYLYHPVWIYIYLYKCRSFRRYHTVTESHVFAYITGPGPPRGLDQEHRS